MTINEALTLMKAARSRISSLESLKHDVSTRELFMDTSKKITEPQYDVKDVDVKVVSLQKIVFRLDNAIKQSNAVTVLNVSDEGQFDEIFEPLK